MKKSLKNIWNKNFFY